MVAAYREHRSAVAQVVYNPHRRTYASLDSSGLRLWHFRRRVAGAPPAASTLKSIDYPQGKRSFVTALLYVPEVHLYFAACMDSCLRLYKHDLRIRARLPWPETLVHTLAFCAARNELVTAGAAGVKARRRCCAARAPARSAAPTATCTQENELSLCCGVEQGLPRCCRTGATLFLPAGIRNRAGSRCVWAHGEGAG